MELEELMKALIFVIVLVVVVGAIFMFREKGGSIFGAIRDALRFGGWHVFI
jgi:hypothetical protein